MAFFNNIKKTVASGWSAGKANLEIEKLQAEQAKVFEFIGREIFDLWAEAKEGEAIELDSIDPFLEKILELATEIFEVTLKAPAVCECGGGMEGGQYFCPQCGKDRRAEVVDALAPPKDKCVCGAMIETDAMMCMECGRRVLAPG